MPKIEPTVGRVVWFFHRPGDAPWPKGYLTHSEMDGVCGPYAAHVADCRIDSEGHDVLTLQVLDRQAGARGVGDVRLLQDGDDRPETGWWAEWMPYQKGQAQAQAELEAQKPAPHPDGEYGPDEHEDAE